MSKNRSIIISLFITLSLFALSTYLNNKVQMPLIKISKQDSAFNISKNFSRIFSLGNKRLVVAIMWIQTLIESDIEHYSGDKYNNWLYIRFDSILTLDPKFVEAYRFGGSYLSVIKDDIDGATDIYERGLAYYPDDYFLNYNAAIHYIYELGETEKAVTYLKRIKDDYRSPPYLPSLIARLEVNNGDMETAYHLLLDSYLKLPDGNNLKDWFKESLYAMRAEMDLKCLNTKRLECNSVDFLGNPYSFNGSSFVAKREWKPFRLKKRASVR